MRSTVGGLWLGLMTLGLLVTSIASLAGPACAAELPSDVLEELERDPARLRKDFVLRRFKDVDPGAFAPLMRRLALDGELAWDLRARAVTMLDGAMESDVLEAFARTFQPSRVAADEWGDETFNILAQWLQREPSGARLIEPLLLPGERTGGLQPILAALAGRGVHDYLYFLHRRGYRFPVTAITALGDTDDQLTRQLLCWYVGDVRLVGMEQFLVDQIRSDRPNTYRTKVDRVVLAAFTAGIGEIIRQAVPKPPWLDDEATPKGLALLALGELLPAGSPIEDAALVDGLMAAASSNAAGTKRGQWQVAVDVLFFLRDRRVSLAPRAEAAAAEMVRQVLRRRGPLVPFVAAEELHRTAGVALPALTADETATIWQVAHSTLDAAFLGALGRAYPDDARRRSLVQHLLDLEDRATRDTLRVARCWGADIEGPGEWALAVAELGVVEAIDGVEAVLQTSWTDDAVRALVRYGAPGAPPLARFLRSDHGPRLERDLAVAAIRACAEHLPDEAWADLAGELATDRSLASAVDEVLRSQPLRQ